MSRALLFFAALVFLHPAHALAEAGDCYDLGNVTAATLGVVIAKEPVHFVASTTQNPACPSPAKVCVEKAYLVAGNEVILSAVKGDYICAAYSDRKGNERNGWLPLAAIKRSTVPPLTGGMKDWLGHWRSDVEHEIRIAPAKKKDFIAIAGDATYGAQDP
jgi:hypothetical protein